MRVVPVSRSLQQRRRPGHRITAAPPEPFGGLRPVQREDGSPWFDVHDDGEYQRRYPALSDAEFAEHCNDIGRFWPEHRD